MYAGLVDSGGLLRHGGWVVVVGGCLRLFSVAAVAG